MACYPPPYEYKLLLSLDETEYPQYLKKIFKANIGKNLNLKHPKTFNEKIQWLKLYDSTPLKTKLTDKVLVRDWVKDKIGDEYLKPVFQICKKFDEIDFDKLPEHLMIKANHGCKWGAKIKNKREFLKNKTVFEHTQQKFDGWMEQTFFGFSAFELQYKDITPLLLVEPLLGHCENDVSFDIDIMCFNGIPKLYKIVDYTHGYEKILFDTVDFREIEDKPQNTEIAELLTKVTDLSQILAQGFKLVRVDWFIVNNKIYFGEMTFTPHSGFFRFVDKTCDLKYGKMLKI